MIEENPAVVAHRVKTCIQEGVGIADLANAACTTPESVACAITAMRDDPSVKRFLSNHGEEDLKAKMQAPRTTASARAAKDRARKKVRAALDHRWWLISEIARRAGVHRETAGHYLRQFVKAGIAEMEEISQANGAKCFRLKESSRDCKNIGGGV